MRRDVYIANDSGGFSVLAADAVDAIIDDARTHDLRFVASHKAMLLELYGDDSLPVRWRVDLYAHVGSMNGRVILGAAPERPGAAFRRDHPGRAFPLWLARMLELSGERDPGFEEPWGDVKASLESGRLALDTAGDDPIGFLVHFTPAGEPPGKLPDGAWFPFAECSRIPERFPLGLASQVPDPDLRSLHDRLLDIRHPEPPRAIADGVVEILEIWADDPLAPIAGGAVPVALDELYLLHWLAGLTSDANPRFELWITPAGAWTPPEPTPDFAVVAKSGGVTAIGPVADTGGRHTWWTSREVARALAGIPDGSTLDLAMRPDETELSDPTSRAGRALYARRARGLRRGRRRVLAGGRLAALAGRRGEPRRPGRTHAADAVAAGLPRALRRRLARGRRRGRGRRLSFATVASTGAAEEIDPGAGPGAAS